MTSDDIPDKHKIWIRPETFLTKIKQDILGAFVTFLSPLSLQTAQGLEFYDRVDESDQWLWYTGSKPFNSAHIAIIILVLATVLGAAQQKILKQNKLGDLFSLPVTAKAAANFTNSVNQFTPAIEEDSIQLAQSIMLSQNDDFYLKPLIAKTKVSDNKSIRTEGEVRYVVQNGDTLSSIGWKYGLKIASIKYINSIEGETIKPGQSLTLPEQDINPAIIEAAARAKAEKARQEELARQRKLAASQYRSTAYRERSYASYDSDGTLPVNSKGISRGISWGHNGIDYLADVGSPVVATASGYISTASYGWNGGYGNEVVINHGDHSTRYAHLSSLTVGTGEYVEQGQIVGYVGMTGRTTGPHLHYEPNAH